MTTRRKVRSEASGPDDLLIESFYLLTLQTDTEFKPIPRQPVHMKLRLEQEDSDTILPQASARGKFSDWPSDMCYNIHAQSDSIMVCLPTPKTIASITIEPYVGKVAFVSPLQPIQSS